MSAASEPPAITNFQDIPVPRRDIVAALREDFGELESGELELGAGMLASLSERLLALYHYEFHSELERLKRDYAPFNPDLDRDQAALGPATRQARAENFSTNLRTVLERGNYKQLDDADVAHAFEQKSLFPLKLVVDTEAYEEAIFYARGDSVREAQIPKWYGLSRDSVVVPTFDRVCLFIRFKSAEALELPPAQAKKLKYEPGTTILKLFRNIPKADLEILFPNCEPRMRVVDKLFFGVPALVGGLPVLAKLAPAAVAIAIAFGMRSGEVNTNSILAGLSGLMVLGTYLFRQWDKFKYRRLMFAKELSDNLYYRNLDNNIGVLTRLVDEAEEEECKEVLLAYVHLLDAGEQLSASELDARVEAWVSERFDLEIDFDVRDGLDKLERFGLVLREDERYRAQPLSTALERLDARWHAL